MSIRTLMAIITWLLLTSCATMNKSVIATNPQITDYSQLKNWAAHPEKKDKADMVPGESQLADQSMLEADVFFVHPTTYTGKSHNRSWNGPIDNPNLNESTDKGTIQFQASAFNHAGKVYAPRYQQAHLSAYYKEDKEAAQQIFDIAYNDVKAAFQYYLNNYNNGRPFIIASHSQGTTHSARLIEELIDGSVLKKQLIAAYLIGMPVKKDIFQNVPPCTKEGDTGCFVSWRTFKRGYIPKDVPMGNKYAVHNPLSWTMDQEPVKASENKGAVLRNFNQLLVNATDAEIHDGILWAGKPKFKFSFLFNRKNYHIADINFYYVNVRENASYRVNRHIRKGKHK